MSKTLETLRLDKQHQERHDKRKIVTTETEHQCGNRNCPIKIIPARSKAYAEKRQEDQFEITDSGVKPLGSKWVTYYTHLDCNNAKLPENKQKDLF